MCWLEVQNRRFVLLILVCLSSLSWKDSTSVRLHQVIDVDYVNTAMERLEKNDVHYRFSIDMLGSLLPPSA